MNALPGVVAQDALSHIHSGAIEGKVLLDTALLPLGRHEGLPPTLTGVEELKLAEQIQRAHLGVRVVKSLNTMAAPLMVDPGRVPGDHVVVTGNYIEANRTVRSLLRQFRWADDVIHDIGDVRTSRDPRCTPTFCFSSPASFGSSDFNIAINRAVPVGTDIRTALEGE